MFRRKDRTAAPHPQAPALTPVELWNRGAWPNVDVVGESYHEAEIRRVLGPVTEHGTEKVCQARLVPEPNNPHDPNAVAVMIGSDLVGYLARDLATAYQPMLLGLASVGKEAVIPCRIYANNATDWETRRSYLFAQVRVTLDEPHLCLPANGFPSTPHAFLEQGSALQLQKESEHMDVLRRYIGTKGERWVVATLHRAAELRGKKPVVELRVDGELIGELTPAMSEHFLTTIEAVEALGKTLAAKVLLRGNQLKIEAALYGQRAHELSAEWIAQNVTPDPQPPAPTTTPRALRFNPPPGWPTPPPGWTPPAGWQPAADWPPAPAGWNFWIEGDAR